VDQMPDLETCCGDLPAVMAKLVGLDCGLNKLARRMKCTQCQGRR
jgi:hypothetical protein